MEVQTDFFFSTPSPESNRPHRITLQAQEAAVKLPLVLLVCRAKCVCRAV